LPGRRRAAAAVEFAICASVLVTVMFAIIEFSRLLQIQHAVRQAALEGARTGITLDATTATTQAQATNILSMAGLTASSPPTVTAVAADGSTSTSSLAYASTGVSVTVSVDPAGNSWYKYFLPAGTLIKATVTLQREVNAISVPGPGP
jgi:Flp pilus assembly protein TadG